MSETHQGCNAQRHSLKNKEKSTPVLCVFGGRAGGGGQAWLLTGSSRSIFSFFLLLRFAVDLAHVELVV